MRIANTLRLHEFTVTPSLLEEIATNSALEVIAGPTALPFDDDGNLRDLGSPGMARVTSDWAFDRHR